MQNLIPTWIYAVRLWTNKKAYAYDITYRCTWWTASKNFAITLCHKPIMKFYFHITNLYTLGVCQNEDWISMICIMFIRISPLIHTERFDCCELIGSSRGFLQRNERTNHSKCLYCVHQACKPAPKQINFFSEIADLMSNFQTTAQLYL